MFFTVVIAIVLIPLTTGASSPPKWVPQSLPCPGRVVGVIDYTSRSAYIIPLQRTTKVAVPRSAGLWRVGCAKIIAVAKDPRWCPTENMKARNPKAKCKEPFKTDPTNPVGVGFIAINFIDDPNDANLGFHGTNDPRVLGTQATSGCTRTENDAISTLIDRKLLRPYMDYPAPDYLYYQWRK